MPTSKLYEKLKESAMWEQEWQDMVKKAIKNSKKKKNPKKKEQDSDKKEKKKKTGMFNKKKERKIFLGTKEQASAARLFIRMLATLEMIIKDPDANIAVRKGNREDFKAAVKLLEKVTLPKYFGILFQKDLFDDYDYVEPYPCWDDWDFK